MKRENQFDQLDTPSLLLDLDKMEENLQEIADFAVEHKIAWRPHIKTHKSIEIAKRQLEYGATGLTVAKVSEAEVMVRSGVKELLIAYPVLSPMKLKRLIPLLKETKLILAIDHPKQAEILNQFFSHTSIAIEVWIKVDTGLHRCGVEAGLETVTLAKEVSKYPHLHLTGLFTHAGHSYGALSSSQIEEIGRYEGEAIVTSAIMCEQAGIPIIHRSVGSTPTYRISGKIPGITEVRPGNAVFFDAIQAGLGVISLDRCAVRVLSSVVSLHSKERLIIDSGSKSLSLDQGAHGNQSVKGFGYVVNHPELTIARLSEEHGIAHFEQETYLSLNDRVEIIPNHVCTVVNLFDRYYLHRKGVIVGEWNIDARGKVH